MLDTQQLKDVFSAKSKDEQYHELLGLFKQLSGRNNHTTYIYAKLISSPELFTHELMNDIYNEACDIYMRTQHNHHEIEKNTFLVCRQRLEMIKKMEAEENNTNPDKILLAL